MYNYDIWYFHASTLEPNAAGSSKTPVYFYLTTYRHIPQENIYYVLRNFNKGYCFVRANVR